ncbi:hypothetical protein CEXT_227241 [Caerostris extrusa]|uniref:Uncharacterized protein n=1 Tax=Caerostris extrusa TaxID=172846 RepID=A0AAV4N9R8_CAEEX|nr:hypothetical protein CEXT_227241 [Caerostris extrusa]
MTNSPFSNEKDQKHCPKRCHLVSIKRFVLHCFLVSYHPGIQIPHSQRFILADGNAIPSAQRNINNNKVPLVYVYIKGMAGETANRNGWARRAELSGGNDPRIKSGPETISRQPTREVSDRRERRSTLETTRGIFHEKRNRKALLSLVVGHFL